MEELRGSLYAALIQQSSALTLMYCAELIESQGYASLQAFLKRIKQDSGKAHQLLLNDNRIKEIQALVNNLKVEHPKTTYLVKLLKQRYSLFQNESNAKGQNEPAASISIRPRVLVFTHYRDSARKVVQILNEDGIKASSVCGTSKKGV